jgi:hypothetical protein
VLRWSATGRLSELNKCRWRRSAHDAQRHVSYGQEHTTSRALGRRPHAAALREGLQPTAGTPCGGVHINSGPTPVSLMHHHAHGPSRSALLRVRTRLSGWGIRMISKFCPVCAAPLIDRALNPSPRCVCSAGCGFVHYNNPTPVIAAIVEHEQSVVLARNKAWPRHFYGLITGFLERGETPQ